LNRPVKKFRKVIRGSTG